MGQANCIQVSKSCLADYSTFLKAGPEKQPPEIQQTGSIPQTSLGSLQDNQSIQWQLDNNYNLSEMAKEQRSQHFYFVVILTTSPL